ncbi:hypothetical protein KIN20_016516 [Parelaphostrongylus tenuis]|uniref:Uncharacterized protein n=1 Tax=Parelaphostrongylus tenuis TaxID=148309 RepID=A0AAD5QT91_PARTN|nr:hypothetical protein KIN20_016516 [Parelaphostrongylus tenuis]
MLLPYGLKQGAITEMIQLILSVYGVSSMSDYILVAVLSRLDRSEVKTALFVKVFVKEGCE